MPSLSQTCFAIAAPGLEPVVAAELATIGIEGTAEPGGVSWAGGVKSVALANLWLRTPSRIIVRVAEFRVRTFFELERQARRVAWKQYLTPGAPVAFRVTCRKSKLYHSDAVAERFLGAVGHVLGVTPAAVQAISMDDDVDGESDSLSSDEVAAPKEKGPSGDTLPQMFIVRLSHDVCTVSVDTSGELLHRRGYRQAIGKAPLRETLAASMLLGAGWRGTTPLVDPLCGSGTIPIEAALMARKIPPGIGRSFAFLRWPGSDRKGWEGLVSRARSQILPRSPVAISGSDRDAGAIEAAIGNAERAGVAADIGWDVKPVSAATAGEVPGLLISNPPFGIRSGDADRVRNLYAQFGNVARKVFAGWEAGLLSPDSRLDQQTKLNLQERFRTSAGGIPVRFLSGEVQG